MMSFLMVKDTAKQEPSSDRLAIANTLLRNLSGCNGMNIKDWIEAHKDEIINHNVKYGMENKKDSTNPSTFCNWIFDNVLQF